MDADYGYDCFDFSISVGPHRPALGLKEQAVGIVPSNYYCMLETLAFYMNISFYI